MAARFQAILPHSHAAFTSWLRFADQSNARMAPRAWWAGPSASLRYLFRDAHELHTKTPPAQGSWRTAGRFPSREYVEAGHLGQYHVQQYYVWTRRPDLLQRLLTVPRSTGIVPTLVPADAVQPLGEWGVFHNQHSGCSPVIHSTLCSGTASLPRLLQTRLAGGWFRYPACGSHPPRIGHIRAPASRGMAEDCWLRRWRLGIPAWDVESV